MQINGINYEVTVEGEGPAIVLLHGFTSNLHTWDALTNQLKANYQVVRFDIIGHGKSDSPKELEPYTIEAQAMVLKEILMNLGILQAHILGYSMGGRLAISFSCMYPHLVSSLILESTTAGIKDKVERVARKISDEQLAKRIESYGIEEFVDYWENIPLFHSTKKLPVEKLTYIRNQRLLNSKQGLINSLLMMGTGSQPSYWEEIKTFTFPVLIIVGEEDTKFCFIAKKLQSNIKNATIKLINDVGHMIHVEKPQIFGTIIEEFLNKTRNN